MEAVNVTQTATTYWLRIGTQSMQTRHISQHGIATQGIDKQILYSRLILQKPPLRFADFQCPFYRVMDGSELLSLSLLLLAVSPLLLFIGSIQAPRQCEKV